jgi:hypothetical protein
MQKKNYPIFWEGKGKGKQLLKKNQERKYLNEILIFRDFGKIEYVCTRPTGIFYSRKDQNKKDLLCRWS